MCVVCAIPSSLGHMYRCFARCRSMDLRLDEAIRWPSSRFVPIKQCVMSRVRKYCLSKLARCRMMHTVRLSSIKPIKSTWNCVLTVVTVARVKFDQTSQHTRTHIHSACIVRPDVVFNRLELPFIVCVCSLCSRRIRLGWPKKKRERKE